MNTDQTDAWGIVTVIGIKAASDMVKLTRAGVSVESDVYIALGNLMKKAMDFSVDNMVYFKLDAHKTEAQK